MSGGVRTPPSGLLWGQAVMQGRCERTLRALRYSVLLYLYLPCVPISSSRWYARNSPSLGIGALSALACSYMPFRLMHACRAQAPASGQGRQLKMRGGASLSTGH